MWGLVVVGMEDLARELAWEIDLPWTPMMSIRHDHRPIVDGGCAAASILLRHVKAIVMARLDLLHRRLEANPVFEPKVLDVGFKISQDLGMMRKIRLITRHGKVGVTHQVTRRIDVQRLVGGGDTVVVVVSP